MDFIDKAKIRLERWITHNEQHLEEYEEFARELEEAGKKGSSEQVREMMDLTNRSNECLRKALKALE